MPLVFVEPTTARVFFSNAAARRMAGGSLAYPQSAEDHLRLFDIRDLDDRPLRIEDVPAVRAARGEAVSGQQVRWYTPSGPKVITVHAARIPAMFGHPETVLIAFDDITALKDVQAQLEEAVRVRQDFLSIAGHELKTPLTSVLLNLSAVDNALQGGARAGDARLAARWQALSRQIGRLEGLVDQLLDVSRITAGKMTLAPEPIELGELVREVVGRFSPTFTPEAATIDVQAGSPVEGSWDRLRLEQILTNLLSNAVKYGAGRPISVEVGATGPGDDAEAWIAVRDRGIGMSERRARADLRALRARRLRTQLRRPGAGSLDRAPGGRRHGRQTSRSKASRAAGRRSRCGCRVARAAPAADRTGHARAPVVVHSPWDGSSRRARPRCSSGGTGWRRPSPASGRTSPSR